MYTSHKKSIGMTEEDSVEVFHNGSFGELSFSKTAALMYCQMKGLNEKEFDESKIERTDPHIIRIIKDLGETANGRYADLKVTNIPLKYNSYFYIDDYDGLESVLIDYKQYKLDKIRDLIANQDSELASCIADILNASEQD